jgi:hypothetical protein
MLFTEFTPRRFVRKLVEYLRESNDVIAKVSKKEWQVTITLRRDLYDKEIEEDVEADFCDIRVDLLQMPKETDPTAVKLIVVKGSPGYFRDTFEEIE